MDAIHQAFSIAIANALWLGLAGALAATVIVALVVPEVALRRPPGTGASRSESSPAPVPVTE